MGRLLWRAIPWQSKQSSVPHTQLPQLNHLTMGATCFLANSAFHFISTTLKPVVLPTQFCVLLTNSVFETHVLSLLWALHSVFPFSLSFTFAKTPTASSHTCAFSVFLHHDPMHSRNTHSPHTYYSHIRTLSYCQSHTPASCLMRYFVLTRSFSGFPLLSLLPNVSSQVLFMEYRSPVYVLAVRAQCVSLLLLLWVYTVFAACPRSAALVLRVVGHLQVCVHCTLWPHYPFVLRC